jgi:hypothetical protein
MIEYMAPLHLKYRARIMGGHITNGTHERAAKWIKTVPGARFDNTRGISYMNGVEYYHDLVFDTEEDLLAFKLAFAGAVY